MCFCCCCWFYFFALFSLRFVFLKKRKKICCIQFYEHFCSSGVILILRLRYGNIHKKKQEIGSAHCFQSFFLFFFLFYLVVDIVVSKACCISSIISNIFYSRVLKTENCKIFDVIMSFIVVCWPNDWNSFLLFWIVRIFFFFLSAFTCLQHKSNENKNIYMISHHSIHLFKFCFMFTIHILKLLFIHTLE